MSGGTKTDLKMVYYPQYQKGGWAGLLILSINIPPSKHNDDQSLVMFLFFLNSRGHDDIGD